MWVTRLITARIFVWLAAITIPFQGLPLAACGCVRIVAQESATTQSCCSRPDNDQPSCCTGAAVCRCDETSSCSQSEPSCCADESLAKSSCQCAGNSRSGCQCGDSCQCGESNVPTKPIAPPVESSSPERIISESASTATVSTIFLSAFSRQHLGLGAGAIALTAHDCCVSLCRFTL